MKKSSNIEPIFVEYDDNNLSHITGGPDYGQPWSSSHAWIEPYSKEYPNFVKSVAEKIVKHPFKITRKSS